MIDRKVVVLIIVGFLAPLLLFGTDGKINFNKRLVETEQIKSHNNTNRAKRVHPKQDVLNQRRAEYVPQIRNANFNKLLVLLVDFPEDDNPATTGNGKFITSPDPDYPLTIGSPPHDREFFEAHLEGMKYYYAAVSFGAFLLDYDVYPKSGAYTLPEKMEYYNPTDENIFLERTEQYFRDVFETADKDTDRPQAFSDYAHYMIIHAGSDYQHDIFGDSPHDLPSYFIYIRDPEKQAVVDGGFKIAHAANVPEYIVQDVQERTYTFVNERGQEFQRTYVFGYGAVNSVFYHEFGHSLGFADLYNTLSGRPAVGVFDIMDSGGSGSIGAANPENPNDPSPLTDRQDPKIYNVEGILPSLPSVWSRLLVWEEYFLQMGILKDIESIDFDKTLNIIASSYRHDNLLNLPDTLAYFYRLKLSDDEYILIENRNVDPDGDGGTSLVTYNGEGRVIMRPAPYDNFDISYEFDWLLPGWMDEDNNSIGGGLLIWHIDNKQIYAMTDDGLTNLENNTVNTNIYGNKAVRVIEADNLHDIGNPYAYYWTGTEYDYFYRYKPILDEYGNWLDWNYDEIHNTELSATSKPALITNTSKPSMWRVWDISNIGNVMSFKVANNMFDITILVETFKQIKQISNVARFRANSQNIAAYGEKQVDGDTLSGLFTYELWNNQFYEDLFFQDIEITEHSMIQAVNFDNKEYFLLIDDNSFLFLCYDEFNLPKEFHSPIIAPPLNFKDARGDHYLGIVFADSSFVIKVSRGSGGLEYGIPLTIPETGKFIADNDFMYLLTERALWRIETERAGYTKMIDLPERFTLFEPVLYAKSDDHTILYLMSDNKVVYSLISPSPHIDYTAVVGIDLPPFNRPIPIFDLKTHTNEAPSQLALGYIPERNSNFILLHTQSWVYVITPDGAFYPNFPMRLENITLQANSHPYIFSFRHPQNNSQETIFMLHDTAQGLLGVDLNGRERREYSLYWDKSEVDQQFFIQNNSLYMLYTDNDQNLLASAKTLQSTDAILWNGFRNSANGALYRTDSTTLTASNPVEVFVYPNPLRQTTGNIKILNIDTNAKLDIYSIAGQKVFTQEINKPTENFYDARFDTSKLSTGVYFVVVEINGKAYRNKFSIIK